MRELECTSLAIRLSAIIGRQVSAIGSANISEIANKAAEAAIKSGLNFSLRNLAGKPLRDRRRMLISIARNRAIDILRSKNPAESAADTDAADLFAKIAEPGDRETEMMDIAALRHYLGTIEEPARACILLAYYEGYSRDELARRFDRPMNTIKTWLHRSLAALKSCLKSVT